MQDTVRVEIVPRTVEADAETMERRAETVRRLDNLGLIADAASGKVGDTVTAGWTARIGGVEFPAVTFSVEPGGEGGNALVSLLIPADEVSIGRHSDTVSPAAAPAQVRPGVPEPKPAVSTWGATKVDPRANIPGWQPEPTLAAQVAGNAVGRLA